MDSFYDAPRRAPVPTQVEKFLPSPAVPEVSIICPPKTCANRCPSYSSWKTQQNRTDPSCILTSNRQNILVRPPTAQIHTQNLNPQPQNTSQLFKKQVRFESPVLQQRPSLSYEPFNTRKGVTENSIKTPVITNGPLKNSETNTQSNKNNIFNGTTFEQIYLANVPNRHLDLSLIDLPIKSRRTDEIIVDNGDHLKQVDSSKTNFKKTEDVELNTLENKENTLPKTYRDFLETQKKIANENKESVTDIFNYKRKFDIERTSDNTKSKDCVAEPIFTKPLESDHATASNVLFNENPRSSKGITSQNHMEMPLMQSKYHESYRYPDIRQHFQNDLRVSPQCNKITQTNTYASQQNHDLDKKRLETPKNDSEPTNRDLLKIIAQQNEQLLILQKQVAMLLNREEQRPKQIEAPPKMNFLGEKCKTSTQNEMFRSPAQDINSPRKQRALSKFSIDLMTSFEVAIRPQHKQNFVNQEPKIQEITESESEVVKDSSSTMDKYDKTLVDTSLHLQEPVKVREMCPSPEPSININMNDYDSSDDDEVSASEIGATFYRNLMGQVNDILRKAQGQSKEDYKDGLNCIDRLKNQTMNRVRDATLKHLKNIGVTIAPIEETCEEVSSVSDGKDYSPTEISFAVKQLLLKYLPDEQLAKITYKQAQCVPFNKAGKPGIIPNRPEFSFASVEYMKKYNLISNNKDLKPKDVDQVPRMSNPQKPEGPKILDITALKMQPKLL